MGAFNRRFSSSKYKEESDLKPGKPRIIRYLKADHPQAKPIEIHEDGTIHAHGFVDLNDDYELFIKNDRLFYKQEIDSIVSRTVDVATAEEEFHTSVHVSIGWYDTFAQIAYTMMPDEWDTRHWYMKPGTSRYKTLNSAAQAEMTDIQERQSALIEPSKTNPAYNQLNFFRSFQFKPMKIPVCIVAGKEVENLSDVMMIKTGEFNVVSDGGPFDGQTSGLKQSKIVWVSPHETIAHSGEMVITGVAFQHRRWNMGRGMQSGLRITGSGVGVAPAATYSGSVSYGVGSVETGINIISSRNFVFASGQMLSGGATYTRRTTLYSGETPTGYISTGVLSPTKASDTEFYSTFSGRMKRPKRSITGSKPDGTNLWGPKVTGYFKDDFADDYAWDGIIPANTPFTVIFMSNGGDRRGLENHFNIQPYDWAYHSMLAISGSGYGDGIHEWEASVKATEDAVLDLGDKIDSLLLKNNLINSGSMLVHYDNFLRGKAGMQKEGLFGDKRFNQGWTGVHGALIASGILSGGGAGE